MWVKKVQKGGFSLIREAEIRSQGLAQTHRLGLDLPQPECTLHAAGVKPWLDGGRSAALSRVLKGRREPGPDVLAGAALVQATQTPGNRSSCSNVPLRGAEY